MSTPGPRASISVRPSFETVEGDSYRADGQLQDSLVAPHWLFHGLVGAFAVFDNAMAHPPLSLRATSGGSTAGATIRATAGPAFGPRAPRCPRPEGSSSSVRPPPSPDGPPPGTPREVASAGAWRFADRVWCRTSPFRPAPGPSRGATSGPESCRTVLSSVAWWCGWDSASSRWRGARFEARRVRHGRPRHQVLHDPPRSNGSARRSFAVAPDSRCDGAAAGAIEHPCSIRMSMRYRARHRVECSDR